MPEPWFNPPLVILLAGASIIAAALVRALMGRLKIPALVGWILLGLVLRLADEKWRFLTGGGHEVFDFLANLGIIVLLFQVGLEANLAGLVRQLRRASAVWAVNVVLSAALGYAVSAFVFGLELVPCLFVATAFTATSVGVSVAVWQEAGALARPDGQLLVDAAELDDISGIALMAVLFALAPALAGRGGGAVMPLLGHTLLPMLVKLVLFAAGCVAFSQFLEARLTTWFSRLPSKSGPVLLLAGTGFMLSAVAGLAFSRDPKAARIDTAFGTIYDLLAPFFFIGIGLSIVPSALGSALGMGAVLLVAAFVSKVVGTALPAMPGSGLRGAVVLGLSMVPRAEIATIIMQRGQTLGNWAVSPQLFAAMVFVVAVTSLATPLLVRPLLRWSASTPA
jgi:Kef-type K+ transport system membrane component KefB